MEIEKRHHELLWDVRRSVRYHNRRRAWFERLHMGTLALAIIALSSLDYGTWVQIAGSVFLATNVVCRFADRASDHKMFASAFRRLEINLLQPPTVETLNNVEAERLTIEGDEPPIKRLLDMLCYYELWKATREDYRHVRISWWRRLTVNWFSYGGYASTLPQPIQ